MRLKRVFCCDFDGTISREDLGLATMRRFAPPEWWDFEQRWRRREISSVECLQAQFGMVKATERQLVDFYRHAKIDPRFKDFCRACKRRGIRVVVLSDGLDFYIERILRRLGLRDVPYFANHMEFVDGRMVFGFPHRNRSCGMCGNCKRRHVARLRKQYDWVGYVGDGHSDRCVVTAGSQRQRLVDEIYAKDALAEHCAEHGIPFHPFRGFRDLTRRVCGLTLRPSLGSIIAT
ncbi:MAG: HAD-IB family phosphatase [Planctomycetes bacterium]|nr:HAD-IB family phosphatase [Planctomycetota bacterium]